MADASRNQKIATWAVSGLLTALYLFAGGMKLFGPPEVVENFTRYGHSDAFRLFIGAAEVSGATVSGFPDSRSGPRPGSS